MLPEEDSFESTLKDPSCGSSSREFANARLELCCLFRRVPLEHRVGNVPCDMALFETEDSVSSSLAFSKGLFSRSRLSSSRLSGTKWLLSGILLPFVIFLQSFSCTPQPSLHTHIDHRIIAPWNKYAFYSLKCLPSIQLWQGIFVYTVIGKSSHFWRFLHLR